MHYLKNLGFTLLLAMFTVGQAMAIEEAKYTTLLKERSFEVRQYEPHIVAETVVDGDLENAGNQAFSPLFKYISGNNRSRDKVAMTAPVGMRAASETISMTSPVAQQQDGDRWVVSFMMPSAYSLETLPAPIDPRVALRRIPKRTMAAVRYSGFWSEKKLPQTCREAQQMGRQKGL
jgi:effector-binding domain-containing protein